MKIAFSCGKEVQVPDKIIEGNNNIENVKSIVNSKLNYYENKMEPDDIGFNVRPSFRDSMAFNFQPQTIIASHDTLYYKTNLTVHREKLIREFLYFLGVIDNQSLYDKIKKKELERERKIIEKKIKEEHKEKIILLQELPELYSRGIDLCLIDSKEIPKDNYLILHKLENLIKHQNLSLIEYPNALDANNEKILSLEVDRDKKHLEIMKYKKFKRLALERIQDIKPSKFDNDYTNRIDLIRWLTSRLIKDKDILLAYMDEEVLFDDVIQSVEKYENSIKNDINEENNLKDELQDIELKLEIATKELYSINNQLNSLYRSEEKARQFRSLMQKTFEYIGEVKSKLDRYNLILSNSDYEKRLGEINVELARIKGRNDKESIDLKTKSINQKISKDTLDIIKNLDADYKYAPINIEIDDLSISISDDAFGKENYLFQLGSASNWLAYHISFLLALHKHFAQLSPRRVFNFIVFDQPSQVYFPEGINENVKETKKSFDKDLENVRKIFRALDQFNSKNKNIQIIVLEHAGKNVWGDNKNIIEIEEWGDDKKLIPNDWISHKIR